MARNSKEIVEYCERLLRERNDTVYNMCSKIDVDRAKLSMWKQKIVDPRLGALVRISMYLGISIDNLVGLEENSDNTFFYVPDDIKEMIDMLLEISERDRKMIKMNIQNYYKVNKLTSKS